MALKLCSFQKTCQAKFLTSGEISDLLLFVCYFASQNEKIKFGNYVFDECCVN